jgi:hypothetical protein
MLKRVSRDLRDIPVVEEVEFLMEADTKDLKMVCLGAQSEQQAAIHFQSANSIVLFAAQAAAAAVLSHFPASIAAAKQNLINDIMRIHISKLAEALAAEMTSLETLEKECKFESNEHIRHYNKSLEATRVSIAAGFSSNMNGVVDFIIEMNDCDNKLLAWVSMNGEQLGGLTEKMTQTRDVMYDMFPGGVAKVN